MLDLLRKLRGPPKLNAYEREVLEKEYQRLARRMDLLEANLGRVHCASCVKTEDPHAKRIIAQKRALQKTLDDIAWKLGYTPELELKSKRARRATG